MRIFVVGLSVILVLALGFTYLNSANGPSSLLVTLQAQPQSQKIAFGVIGLVVVLLFGCALWQALSLSQQTNTIQELKGRLDGMRQSVRSLDETQKSAEMAVGHLVGSDPEAAITTIEQRLDEAERVTRLQDSRTEAVDMQSRVESIRERQEALKTELGNVVAKRRSVDPIITDLRERQLALERGLADLEKDQTGDNLETRLGYLATFITQTNSRFEEVERALVTLGQMKIEFGELRTRIVPLKAPEGGIKSLIDELRANRERIAADLDRLEQDGDSKLSDRVKEFAANERELDVRVSSVTEQFANLDTIRKDITALFARLTEALNAHAASKTN